MDDAEQPEALAARLWVDAPLAEGGGVMLDHNQTHYLRNVLRLKPGAEVGLFNGVDGEWAARLDGLAKSSASLRLLQQRRCQPAPEDQSDCWLAFAPIKRARIDLLVEKATELGASTLYPIWTERTNVARLNLDRLSAHAREAAEQCERLSVPVIAPATKLDEFLTNCPPDRRILICDETGGGFGLAAYLREQPPSPGGWVILIGPEGGWSGRELDGFRNMSNVACVGLGPRILRADTAALAALAVFQAMKGDWSREQRRSGSFT